jgi:hypothetical protein
MTLLRKKICQKINRAAKAAKHRSQFDQGYITALSQVVHLIDKMRSAETDDYDQHRHSGLLEEGES